MDSDTRDALYGHIVLAGGSSMFPGFDARLKQEISKLTPPHKPPVKVVAPPDRHISAWKGGSILASLSTFNDMWITKEEYDSAGPNVVHRKCF